MRTPKWTEFEWQDNGQCPLCRDRMFREKVDDEGYRSFTCKNCGAYRITEDLQKSLLSSSDPDLVNLARYAGCHTRQSYQRDGDLVSLNEQNWKQLASCRANTGPEEHIELLLDLLRELSGRPGRATKFDYLDFSQGFMVNRPYPDSFTELVQTAIDRGYFSLDSEWRFTLRSQVFFRAGSTVTPTHIVVSHQGSVTSKASAQKLNSTQSRDALNDKLRIDYKQLLKETGHKQEWLAHEIGASPSTISRFMKGSNLRNDNYDKARASVDSELSKS